MNFWSMYDDRLPIETTEVNGGQMTESANERCPTCEMPKDNPNCMIARCQRLDGMEKWYVHDGPCQLCIDSFHDLAAPTAPSEERKAAEASFAIRGWLARAAVTRDVRCARCGEILKLGPCDDTTVHVEPCACAAVTRTEGK